VKPEDCWSRSRPLPPSPQTQGRPCGRPPSRRQRHDGRRGTGSPCRVVLSPWRCGRPRRSDCDEVWAASNLRGSYRRQPAPPTATRARSMSAGRLARSSGVAGHGLVQPAEGLLDAGVEVASTLGAVLDCRHQFGRWRQPCPGLVGHRAGLVALGAVEAIIRVWRQGVGQSDHPSWVAVRVGGQAGAEVGGNVEAPARAAVPSASCWVESTCACRNLGVDFAGNLR
jgi:hypothetical protein